MSDTLTVVLTRGEVAALLERLDMERALPTMWTAEGRVVEKAFPTLARDDLMSALTKLERAALLT